MTVERLGLYAVQLHGDESQEYIRELRQLLPINCQIWKAMSINDAIPARNLLHVDRYVFDNGNGGTGQAFDWNLLQGKTLDNVMLAGGLNASNCVMAAKLGSAGLDFNSGVESAPGKKDRQKLEAVFQTLRAY